MSISPPQSNSIAIKDEGITISQRTTSIDFVGAGVTGSILGGAVTETIPGGSGGTGVVGEALTPTGDPLVFTSAHIPIDEPRTFIGSARVFPTADYTRSTSTWTFILIPQATPQVDYTF